IASQLHWRGSSPAGTTIRPAETCIAPCTCLGTFSGATREWVLLLWLLLSGRRPARRQARQPLFPPSQRARGPAVTSLSSLGIDCFGQCAVESATAGAVFFFSELGPHCR